MKKLASLLLALVMMLCLCSCGVMEAINSSIAPDADDVSKDVESGAVSLGVVENNVYRNDYFGIRCELSEDWTFYSEEEILELNNVSIDSSGIDWSNAPIIYDMYATHQTNFSSININMEKLSSLAASDLDIKSYLEPQFDAIKSGLTNTGYSNVTVEYAKITVDGRQYDGIKVHGDIQGIDFYEVIFCYRKGNYLVNTAVATLQTDTTAEMLSAFTIS